ncbi:MAG: hypothetical protein WB679_08825 [Terracidiphilus sp.]
MLLMLYDAAPIALWSLIVAIIGAVIALVAAVAAIYAAVYAKAAPTKEDLRRVEEHTAATSDHLNSQRKREELAHKAARISIAIHGQTIGNEPMTLHLTLKDPAVTLMDLDLCNESQSLLGSVPCKHVTGMQYTAKVSTQVMGLWFASGTPVQTVQRARLVVRAHLDIEGKVFPREMTVLATSFFAKDIDKPTQTTGVLVDGEV